MKENARKPKDKVLTLRVDQDLLRQIEAESKSRDLSQAQIVRDALRSWMQSRQDKDRNQ